MARAKHIPEWEQYDAEVARFTRQLAEQGKIRSGMSTADANVLADVGAGKAILPEEREEQESQNSSEEPLHRKDEL